MSRLTKVTFEPHDARFSKVTGECNDGSVQVVFLDNVSIQHFLRSALFQGQAAAAFGGVGLWI